MYEPFDNRNWLAPHDTGRDVVSEQLTRRAVAITIAVLSGLGVGVLALLLAGPQGTGRFLPFLPLALIALFLAVRYFEGAIVAVLLMSWSTVGSPAVAQGGSGGGEQRLFIVHIGLGLLLAIWLGRTLLAGRLEVYKTPVNAPMVCYFVLSAWSTLNSMLLPNTQVLLSSPKQYWQVNLLEILTRILAFGGVFLLANNLKGKYLKWAAWVLVIPGVVTFLNLVPFLPQARFIAFPHIWSMAILAAFTIADKTKWWVRVLCGGLTLTIFGLYFLKNTEWVSGWGGATAALAVLLFNVRPKLFWAGAAAVVLLVAVNFQYFYDKAYKDNFYGNGSTQYAERKGHMGTFENDRARMLRASFSYAAYFPLGIGLGNYRSYNKYFGRINVWNTTTFTSAHGTYAQTLTESGWPGFVAFMLILYASARALKAYWQALPPGWQKTYLSGTYAGVIGMFCASFNGDYLLPTYHNAGMISFGACVYTWYMIGISMAIARENGLDWDRLIGRTKTDRLIAPVYNRLDALPPVPNPGAENA